MEFKNVLEEISKLADQDQNLGRYVAESLEQLVIQNGWSDSLPGETTPGNVRFDMDFAIQMLKDVDDLIMPC